MIDAPGGRSVAFAALGYFYQTVLPVWLGLDTQGFRPGI